MICDFAAVSPPVRVYRIGRSPDPWAWPDWAYAPFGNRFDDPEEEYRVLYASSQRLGTFIETLARFRPDPALIAELAEIRSDPRDDSFPTAPPGRVPLSWLKIRRMGLGRVRGSFADIGHTRSLSYLRTTMAARLLHYGLPDLDGHAIRISAPRAFTQEISRRVYSCSTATGERAFLGVRYLSRLGDQLENWAICEPAEIGVPASEPLAPADEDFREALDLLDLELA